MTNNTELNETESSANTGKLLHEMGTIFSLKEITCDSVSPLSDVVLAKSCEAIFESTLTFTACVYVNSFDQPLSLNLVESLTIVSLDEINCVVELSSSIDVLVLTERDYEVISNNTDSIQYPSAAHDEALLDTLDSMFINEKLTPSQSQPQIDPRDRVNNQNG